MEYRRLSLEFALSNLEKENYTCVLTDGIQIFSSRLRGVMPLVKFIKENYILEGFFAADRVVGKATAYLYVLMKIQALYAKIISKPAIDVLKAYGIKVEYDVLVDNIINRRGDGICPFEEAVLHIEEPIDAYEAILKKMKEMNLKI